jgi:predicted DNA-binding transcriptional regulator AlpA
MKKLLKKKEVAGRIGYHPESIMRMSREGTFPKAIKMGNRPNCGTRFLEEEVDAWIEERLASRDQHRPSSTVVEHIYVPKQKSPSS